MKKYNLTNRQSEVRAELPAATDEIASKLGITESTVLDHISGMRMRGVPVEVDNGVYFEKSSDVETVSVSAPLRQQTKTKAALSREVNDYLQKLESEIKEYRQLAGPVISDGGEANSGGMDLIIPCSDDHFGDMVPDTKHPDPYGNPLFTGEIAADRVHQKFEMAHLIADGREAMGYTIDSVTVPMLGDLVTNEAIYHSQVWHLEPKMHIRNQLKLATEVYGAELQRLADRFPHVQVVCFHGNHGEFRQGGQSHHANADDLLYDRLELLFGALGTDNITFVRSDVDDHVLFTVRGGRWVGFAVHGEHCAPHIGTKSPLAWWQDQLIEYQWDFAFRCHYHNSKEEPVSGRPVHLLPSIKDGGDYEAKMGIHSRPKGVIFGSTDEEPLAFKEWISFS